MPERNTITVRVARRLKERFEAVNTGTWRNFPDFVNDKVREGIREMERLSILGIEKTTLEDLDKLRQILRNPEVLAIVDRLRSDDPESQE